jgi:hypothetical protein
MGGMGGWRRALPAHTTINFPCSTRSPQGDAWITEPSDLNPDIQGAIRKGRPSVLLQVMSPMQ